MAKSIESTGGNCFNRVPYGSLLALLICWVGIGLFCSMMYFAVNRSVKMAHEIFGIEMPWLDKIQLTFIIVAVIMGVAALVLFILGVLATGETRRSVYKGWTARLGGRISSAVFLGITYLLHLFWLLVFSGSVCLGFVFFVFHRLCQQPGGRPACLDFSSFTPLLNGTLVQHTHTFPDGRICDRQVLKFCSITNDAWPEFLVGYIGCAMVLLALTHFMACLAANYAHIKDEIKYIELNEIHAEYKLDERM